MSRTLTAAMLSELQAGTVRPALLAAIETASGTVRVWSGIGDLVWGGNTYTGVGDLGGVSAIKETSSLEATGCNFQLSGVPASMVSTALGQIRYGRSAKLWLALLDASGAVIADPYAIFSGLTDNATIDETPEAPRITIAAESRFIDLDRPRNRRYTTEDQQIDYPADLGFEFVPGLQDAQIIFGSD